MSSKTISIKPLAILLLLSMLFVLYFKVTDLIDTQKAIDRYGRLSSQARDALVEARNRLAVELIGFVFLYIVLAFGFNFIKIEQQQEISTRTQDNESIESKQTVKPTKPQKTIKPLTKKTQNIIAILSTSVFMLVFVWQVFSNIPNTTMDFDIPMFFIEQAMKGVIAFLIVGILAYCVAKYR